MGLLKIIHKYLSQWHPVDTPVVGGYTVSDEEDAFTLDPWPSLSARCRRMVSFTYRVTRRCRSWCEMLRCVTPKQAAVRQKSHVSNWPLKHHQRNNLLLVLGLTKVTAARTLQHAEQSLFVSRPPCCSQSLHTSSQLIACNLCIPHHSSLHVISAYLNPTHCM